MKCNRCGGPIATGEPECPKCGLAVAPISNLFIVGSYVLAVLFPVVGLVAGIYLAFNRRRGHSYGVFAVSMTTLIVWGSLVVGGYVKL